MHQIRDVQKCVTVARFRQNDASSPKNGARQASSFLAVQSHAESPNWHPTLPDCATCAWPVLPKTTQGGPNAAFSRVFLQAPGAAQGRERGPSGPPWRAPRRVQPAMNGVHAKFKFFLSKPYFFTELSRIWRALKLREGRSFLPISRFWVGKC